MSKKKTKRVNTQSKFSTYLRKPAVQLGLVALIVLIVYLIASSAGGGTSTSGMAAEISVDEAYQMYQGGTYVLDVRTQEEWDEYHVPNTTLIPLDELPNRVSEVPQGQKIVVICRSGNRSDDGRDILRQAGYDATSVTGGVKEWFAKGYPIEGAPAQ
jgi:rhodanese-related sulfurtransferase